MLRRKSEKGEEPAAGSEAEAGESTEAEAPLAAPGEETTPEAQAPAEVEPAGILEEDVRDEEIEVTPGPVANHSPEPQTAAERLTATAAEKS